MDTMTLDDIRQTVSSACREYDVDRLDAFGSLARGQAGEDSDLDFLVEFREPDRSPARRFFGLLHFLEDTFGRPVDLLTVAGLRNPYFKRRVQQERVAVYEG